MEVAASIIGIAATGAQVATALTKFSISYLGAEKKIEEIAARASLSATILHSIGETVNENETLFKKAEFLSTWSEVLGAASSSYERLQAGLEKARGPGQKKLGMGVWKRFVWGLGGEDRAKDLDQALEKCCSQIMMMQQVIQWKVLQKIVPTDKDAQEKEELKEKLNWIVKGLLESGLISSSKSPNPGEVEPKIVLTAEISKSYQQDRGNLDIFSDSVPIQTNLMAKDNSMANTTGTSTPLTQSSNIDIGIQRFEAYYFIPDIFEDDLHNRAIRVAQAKPNSYICIRADLENDATSQILVSSTKLRHHQSIKSITRRLRQAPKAAQTEIENFVQLRTNTSNDTMCTIADFQEFDFFPNNSTHGSSGIDDVLSAFLVVFITRNEFLNSQKLASTSSPVAVERDGQYEILLEHELRSSGMDEEQIATTLRTDKPENYQKPHPIYTRLSRRYLSLETLNQHGIKYELDEDPGYILIKRWVPEFEQEFLWKHTSSIRAARSHVESNVVEVQESPHHSEPEFEFVRKQDKKKSTPFPLSFLLKRGRVFERRQEDKVNLSPGVLENKKRSQHSRPSQRMDEDVVARPRPRLTESPGGRHDSSIKSEEEVRKVREYERRRAEAETAMKKSMELRTRELMLKREYESRRAKQEAASKETEGIRLDAFELEERENELMVQGGEQLVGSTEGIYDKSIDETPTLHDKQAEDILDQFLATFSV